MAIITKDDLPADVVASVEDHVLEAMIDGANARAVRVAPCLDAPTGEQSAEAKLILIGAIKRWAETGSGAYTQEQMTAGAFSMNHSMDTRQRTGFGLWPSEIEQLQDLCDSDAGTRRAYMIDQTRPVDAGDDLDDRPDLWFQYRWGSRP